MTVLRDYIPQSSNLSAQPVTDMFFSDFNKSVEGSNLLLQGATLRTSTAYGRSATVKAGEDLRPALESLRAAGGGTLILLAGTHIVPYTIVGFSNLRIIGEGKDITIVDFNAIGAGISFTGVVGSTIIKNIEVSNLTFQNSANISPNSMFFMRNCENFLVSNVRVTAAATPADGFEIEGCRYGEFRNCLSDHNDDSFVIRGSTTLGYSQHIEFRNCISSENTGIGFYLIPSGNKYAILNLSFINCQAYANLAEGFHIAAPSTTPIIEAHILFLNCQVNACESSGFYASGNFYYVTYIGCHAFDCIGEGFYQDGGRMSVIGCFSNNNSTRGMVFWDPYVALIGSHMYNNGVGESYVQMSGAHSTIVGNISNGKIYPQEPNTAVVGNVVEQTTTLVPASDGFPYSDATSEYVLIAGNIGDSFSTKRVPSRMQNTSGGSIAEGDIVVLKANADADQVTTTTTLGDDLVYGIALETIANNDYGDFLVEGPTDQLHVDGTTDIAIGDFIATFTTAKIGCKAAAGDMAFAIAMEAYTTNDSNGVINAILIKPRKI